MPIFRKKFGKHHYRGKDKEVHVIKAGETIECEPEFLGSAISTFEEVKEEKKLISKALDTIPKDIEEVLEPKPVKKTKFKRKNEG